MTIEASAVDFLHVAERSEWVHPLSGLVIRDEDMPDELLPDEARTLGYADADQLVSFARACGFRVDPWQARLLASWAPRRRA